MSYSLLCLGLTVLLKQYSVKENSVLFQEQECHLQYQPFHASLNYFFPQFKTQFTSKADICIPG